MKLIIGMHVKGQITKNEPVVGRNIFLPDKSLRNGGYYDKSRIIRINKTVSDEMER